MKKQISLCSILLGFLFITSAVIISSCNDEKTFYKVSFDTQGGSAIDPIVLDGQKTIAKPTPNPTRDGYTFGGWFSNANATTAFDFDVPIKENITIYAKWNIVDTQQFKVTFETGEGFPKVDTQNVDKDKKVTEPTPTRAGYEVEGWYTDKDKTKAFDFDTPITVNITLYTKWNIVDVDTQKFTVTFNANEGKDSPKAQVIKKDAKATLPSANDNPTREGFVFAGWYKEADTKTLFDFANTPITSNITLYAKWSDNAVKVSFETGEGFPKVDAQNVEKNTKATEPTPTRTGYTLEGWYTDKDKTKAFDFDMPITEDTMLYAKWKVVVKQKFTVTFSANEGKDSPKAQVIEEDAKAILPSAKDNPTREGFIFVGWYKEADTKTLFDFANTPITSNITVYAKWSDNESTIKVSFETGEGFPKVDAQDVEKNTKVAEPTPTRTDYEVEGWYTDKDKTKAFDFDTPITENITLYAKWLRLFTVTFNLNGGNSIKPDNQAVKDGGTVKVPKSPTRNGYEFEGWFISNSATTAFNFDTPITENTALTAKWKKETFTVTFSANKGKDAPKAQVIEKDAKATLPSANDNPTREGFIFAGWYKEADTKTLFDFANTPITSNITVYAKWSNQVLKVSFETGEDFPKVDAQNVEKNTKVAEPTPTRAGYEVEGWYTDKDKTKAFDFDTPIIVNITLYAKWLRSFTVTFNLNGGQSTKPANQTVKNGDKATKPADPTRTGYDFNGWFVSDSATTAFNFDTPITENTALTAKWEKQSYTVAFNLNEGDGTKPADQTILYQEKATKPADPTRTGYDFNGWFVSDSATTAFNFDTPITENTALTAKWEKQSYTVTFNLNEGDGTKPADQTILYQEKATKSADPTRSGYKFEGWFVSDSATIAFNFDTPITENIALTAKWEKQLFTITFNLNEGDGTKPNQTILYQEKATKPADPTRTGYKFEGWFVSDTATSAFDFNTPITENIALTAKWEKQSYTVTFNLNEGDGIKPTDQTILYQEKATKPADPTRDNYRFEGWFVSDSATTAFDFDTPITANTALTAKWEKQSYTVTFNLNEGNGTKPADQTILYQEKVTKPADPTRDNYRFEGWFVSDTATSAFDFNTPITENTALTAKWQREKESYTVTFDTKGGSTVAAANVANGKKVAQPNPSPTKDGNNLYGWYTDDITNDAFDFDTPITKDFTLYARYRLKPANKQELQNIINPLISANSRVNLNHIDTSLIKEMSGLFYQKDFNGNISEWNVSNVTKMDLMFGFTPFNQDISKWNVGSVINMNLIFFKASNFNQDISNWNVSNVTNMASMFSEASNFNQDISNWNVGNVTNMEQMFAETPFNQDISKWNVSNVTSMRNMFDTASRFNQNLSGWNVGNVTSMRGMFSRASNFNQDISNWNVSNVTSMRNMFSFASNFNQDISNWNVGNVTNMAYMFDNASQFDQNLSGWDVAKVTEKSAAFQGTPMENDASKKPTGF